VLHVLTKKGKGYEAALQHPEKFHGLGPYDPVTGATPAAKPGTPPAYQDVFWPTMVRLCQKDNTLVGITAAMPTGTGLKDSRKSAAQNVITMSASRKNTPCFFAAGMATMGFHPVVAIYSTFPATRLRLHHS